MIIIDGNMLAHRAFHKMDFLTNSKGVHTGMEYGFLRSIESLEQKFPDEKIIICFDTAHNRKKDACERYKANRTKAKEGFYVRIKALQGFCSCFWDLAWQYGEEADDVMYAIGKKATEHVYLYSNDNDLLQCVNENVTVLKSHESKLFNWTIDKVREKYLVDPENLVLFRSFVGDKSDNLDGVPRIQKRILADAIYFALGKFDGDVNEEMAYCIANYTAWSNPMSNKITQFINAGLWKENYDLMKLIEIDHTYRDMAFNKDLVIKWLTIWEIGSLKLAEPYKELLCNEEEF